MPPGFFRLPGKPKEPEERVWVAPVFVQCKHCRRPNPTHFEHCGACGERVIRPQEPPPPKKK